jgi:hypothetical protein
VQMCATCVCILLSRQCRMLWARQVYVRSLNLSVTISVKRSSCSVVTRRDEKAKCSSGKLQDIAGYICL